VSAAGSFPPKAEMKARSIRSHRYKWLGIIAIVFSISVQQFAQTMGGTNRGPGYNHLVDDFKKDYPGFEGQGITALIMDEGAVRRTHQEFRREMKVPGTRVMVLTKHSVSDHSTAIAGIMAGLGTAPAAKGMAPGLNVVSEDSIDSLRKLNLLAPRIQVAVLSDNSHVFSKLDPLTQSLVWTGAKTTAPKSSESGKYAGSTSELDSILRKFESLITFVPAVSSKLDSPFKTVAGLCLAKNSLCVGTIEDIALSRPIALEAYSGGGPADDGRIKPDLVAGGHNVPSPSGKSDTSYLAMTDPMVGTSVAAGISALLMQLYAKHRATPNMHVPWSSVIKAILIHSATDAGTRGPDPFFGWGSINTRLAGQVIAQRDAAGSFKHTIVTGAISATKPPDYRLTTTGGPIKITLVWTDLPAPPNRGLVDDPTPALVNDLDIRLLAPDGTIYYPYSLDRAEPVAIARTDRPNRVDNVEVIDVRKPARSSDTWTLEIRARHLQGSSQPFAVVVSGLAIKATN
jgi:serine protease AprX